MTGKIAKKILEMEKDKLMSKPESDRDWELITALDLAIDALKQGEWTPVSEGLPKKNMACLVAVGKLNFTQISMYSDLMGTINHRIFYQGDYGHENFENITQYVNAWKPLSKTYKEAEDD